MLYDDFVALFRLFWEVISGAAGEIVEPVCMFVATKRVSDTFKDSIKYISPAALKCFAIPSQCESPEAGTNGTIERPASQHVVTC